jgi:Uncharacterised nucleotidyltransferase
MFADEGVNVIPSKGPTLAALAYGDLGLREFDDLDLLIARPDFMIDEQTGSQTGHVLIRVSSDFSRRSFSCSSKVIKPTPFHLSRTEQRPPKKF